MVFLYFNLEFGLLQKISRMDFIHLRAITFFVLLNIYLEGGRGEFFEVNKSGFLFLF